ncbi:hypothetical protein [Couchioplanes caeruleus]|uniref:Uncharacterized protein n=1 Tax=Couchioplanes caeruleus TaxID=56438 RepID=A0A3N1GM45_9ACTN|nr:hypothetical protein [Couchioplanes caeruleus]ROP31344.1 hypothetical protein EDD30_4243 [Couchioplanes caeruleus]
MGTDEVEADERPPSSREVDSSTQTVRIGGDWFLGDKSVWDAAHMALVWLGGAVSTGVVGNAAYDALEGILRRLRRAEPDEQAAIGHADAVSLAQIAVMQRFDELGLQALADGDITGVEARQPYTGRWWVYLSGPRMSIKVDIVGYEPKREALQTTVSLLRHPAIDEARRTAWGTDDALRVAVPADSENTKHIAKPGPDPHPHA